MKFMSSCLFVTVQYHIPSTGMTISFHGNKITGRKSFHSKRKMGHLPKQTQDEWHSTPLLPLSSPVCSRPRSTTDPTSRTAPRCLCFHAVPSWASSTVMPRCSLVTSLSFNLCVNHLTVTVHSGKEGLDQNCLFTEN